MEISDKNGKVISTQIYQCSNELLVGGIEMFEEKENTQKYTIKILYKKKIHTQTIVQNSSTGKVP